MNERKNQRKIKVAILAEEPLGWGSGKHYFPVILNNYRWKNDQIEYEIITSFIYDKDIIENKLTTSSYDVLLVPGGGVGDGECMTKGFYHLPRVKKWKKNIKNFIKQGGGYVGICGGAALLTDLKTDGKQKTFVERQYDKSSVNVSKVKSYYNHLAIPLFYPNQQKNPDHVGATAYVFSFQPGETDDGRRVFSAGIPIEFSIDTTHEFFKDYPHDTLKMRWWGGPGLINPDQNDSTNVSAIASFPSSRITNEKKIMIHAWRYTGGFSGLLQGFKKSLDFVTKEKLDIKKIFTYTFYFAGDWEKTDTVIDLDLSGKKAMTLETYPNEYKGRIFLCSTHPEYMIWNDGYIEEIDDKEFNCIANGFHRWKSIKHFSHDGLKELTATWWIIRRAVAWAAKVPSNDYPPIFEKNKMDDAVKNLAQNLFWDGTLKKQINDI